MPLFQRLCAVAGQGLERKLALVDGSSRLTYEELLRGAGQFCDELIAAGVQRGERVGLILPNGHAFIIAAFGVWKRGAILVPLNPQLTEAELLEYVLDSHVCAVVTATRHSSVIYALQARARHIEHVWLCSAEGEQWTYTGMRNMDARDAKLASSGAAAADPWAITQYSTGSSGHPKRITRSQGQLLGEFLAVSSTLQTRPEDNVLGVAPFFHSHGLMNAAMLTLLSGGTLHICNAFFPRDVARLIERERITGLPGVPFMFQLLAELRESHDLSCVRFALSAGAPLAGETLQAFRRVYGIGIRQLYGTTETGVIAIRGEDADGDSVGRPIPEVTVTIVDDTGRPVPAGTPGRVRVRSPFAASAYDTPVATNESHFSTAGFFPGDLALWSPQGDLVLCGRERGFINVSGNKVDPAEVEAALLELAGVTEVAVVGIADGACSEKIKAVMVTRGALSHEEIRNHCMQRLAPFKHPKVIEFREQLPKSPLGKVLRKYLLEEASDARGQYIFKPATGLGAAHDAESCDLANVAPFLRVLLSTDGTVTKSLEAYFWEPIDVQVLTHAHARSERDNPGLQIATGDPILLRRVVLRGKVTRSVYAFAVSIMPSNSLDAELRRKLIDEKKGIGELLREGRLETYREVQVVRRADAGEHAVHLEVDSDASVLIRRYQIHHGRRAVIEIEEIFPEARFHEPRQPWTRCQAG